MLEILAEAFIGKVVDLALDRLRGKIHLSSDDAAQVKVHRDNTAIADHLVMVNRWAAEISFRELWKSKALRESFVDLDLHLGMGRSPAHAQTGRPLRVSDLIDLQGHYILLGDPGAGKTTTLKQVASKALDRAVEQRKSLLPILIRLRELGPKESLTSAILILLGVVTNFDANASSKFRVSFQQRVVANVLDNLQCLLLVDGLDEIPPTTRDRVMEELKYYFLRLTSSRVIVTCRTGDYNYQAEAAQVTTLDPLTETQIRQFTIRWLGQEKAPEFLEKIAGNPYAGSEVRPLTLAHLCAIYERSGDIPEKPRTVYRKIVRLLLEEWDEQRGVRRHSRYAEFKVDRKEDFLEAIAFQLTTRFRKSHFHEFELRRAYYEVHEMFGLPRQEADHVARELESHTGLIVEATYGEYEFAHKSIQEYLSASYITKLPIIPSENLEDMPHEMALAVALSSHATHYCSGVLRTLIALKRRGVPAFTEAFISRLVLERVDLLPDREFGALLIALSSIVYQSLSPSERGPFIAKNREFLSVAAVEASLARALEKVSVVKKVDDTYSVVMMPSLAHITVFQSDRAPSLLKLPINGLFLQALGYR